MGKIIMEGNRDTGTFHMTMWSFYESQDETISRGQYKRHYTSGRGRLYKTEELLKGY